MIKTETADQTCTFRQNGVDIGIPEPTAADLLIEIDLIENLPDGTDPNVDFTGAPIPRSYPLDVGTTAGDSGSITQMLLRDGTIVLDLCTTADSCPEPGDIDPDARLRLVCREAGTRVFSGDFEPIVADLAVSLETDASAPADEVVAGSGEGRVVTLTASNLGALDVGNVNVAVDGILPPVGAACPQLLTAGVDFEFDQNCSGIWSSGDLAGGESRQIQFRVTADADAQLEDRISLDASIGAAGIDDANTLNNQQSLDLIIAKQATLQVGLSSVPKLILDVAQTPATASFGMSVTPQGPSDLNRPVDLQLGFPTGSNVNVTSPNANFNVSNGVWSPVVGATGTVSQLTVFFTVDSFEPGVDNFCLELLGVSDPASTRVDLTTSGDTQRCLDVTGPESVNLSLVANAPATAVAGSAPAPGEPGNLKHTFTLSNQNETFDARELAASIQVGAEALLVGVEPPGSLSEDGSSPGLWNWNIGTLAAGQQVSADFFFDVPPGAAVGDLVDANLSGLSVAADQVLVDPAAQAASSTTIARAYDLASAVDQSFPKPGIDVVAEPGSAPVGNLEFLFEVRHADLNASNASQLLAGFSVSGPQGAALPAGTVTIDSVSVPTGDSTSGSGLQRGWDIGTLGNDVVINPRATIVLTVFEGIGDGARVCMVGTIISSAANESETNPGNDQAEVCATVSDGSP